MILWLSGEDREKLGRLADGVGRLAEATEKLVAAMLAGLPSRAVASVAWHVSQPKEE